MSFEFGFESGKGIHAADILRGEIQRRGVTELKEDNQAD